MGIYRVLYYSTVTVGSGGRITIPQDMRDDLDLQDGAVRRVKNSSRSGKREKADGARVISRAPARS
jgi:bifunctional DNA-binding transcriptional regulator/antitoxin component of YhaV-PrlF toxin-antitoxin module